MWEARAAEGRFRAARQYVHAQPEARPHMFRSLIEYLEKVRNQALRFKAFGKMSGEPLVLRFLFESRPPRQQFVSQLPDRESALFLPSRVPLRTTKNLPLFGLL